MDHRACLAYAKRKQELVHVKQISIKGGVKVYPLPHHHELRPDVPQGPIPGEGNRGDQEADGEAQDVNLEEILCR